MNQWVESKQWVCLLAIPESPPTEKRQKMKQLINLKNAQIGFVVAIEKTFVVTKLIINEATYPSN